MYILNMIGSCLFLHLDDIVVLPLGGNVLEPGLQDLQASVSIVVAPEDKKLMLEQGPYDLQMWNLQSAETEKPPFKTSLQKRANQKMKLANEQLRKCSNRIMVVLLSAQIGKYDRTTDKPTNRRTEGQGVTQGNYTSNNKIRRLLIDLHRVKKNCRSKVITISELQKIGTRK